MCAARLLFEMSHSKSFSLTDTSSTFEGLLVRVTVLTVPEREPDLYRTVTDVPLAPPICRIVGFVVPQPKANKASAAIAILTEDFIDEYFRLTWLAFQDVFQPVHLIEMRPDTDKTQLRSQRLRGGIVRADAQDKLGSNPLLCHFASTT
jgi:hypothetical protein